VPLTALFEAFIRAILNAPVKLAPKPNLTAKAGTKIMDATTKPVPNNKEPFLIFLLLRALIADSFFHLCHT